MKQIFWRFIKDDSGVTTIEYGLIAGFISMAILSVITSLGDSTSSFFSILSSDIQNIATGVEPGDD